jgi:hypothetical protein
MNRRRPIAGLTTVSALKWVARFQAATLFHFDSEESGQGDPPNGISLRPSGPLVSYRDGEVIENLDVEARRRPGALPRHHWKTSRTGHLRWARSVKGIPHFSAYG